MPRCRHPGARGASVDACAGAGAGGMPMPRCGAHQPDYAEDGEGGERFGVVGLLLRPAAKVKLSVNIRIIFYFSCRHQHIRTTSIRWSAYSKKKLLL